MANEVSLEQLVTAPIQAVYGANIDLVSSTLKYIQTVGLNEDNTIRTQTIIYDKLALDKDNQSIKETIQLDIPLLSMVNIPDLQIESASFEFNVEVADCICIEDSEIHSESLNQAPLHIGGRVAACNEYIRKTDHTPKLKFNIKTTSVERTEGLARLQDLMNSSMIPRNVQTKNLDVFGNPISENEEELKIKSRVEKIEKIYKVLQKEKLEVEEEIKKFLITERNNLNEKDNGDWKENIEEVSCEQLLEHIDEMEESVMKRQKVLELQKLKKLILEQMEAADSQMEAEILALRQYRIKMLASELEEYHE